MTTALEKYLSLEAIADYYPQKNTTKQVVLVQMGKETLTLLGAQFSAEQIWPLATLKLMGRKYRVRGELCLNPDSGTDERLVMRDPTMIAALIEICPHLTPESLKYQLAPNLGAVGLRGWLGLVTLLLVFLVLFGALIIYFGLSIGADLKVPW